MLPVVGYIDALFAAKGQFNWLTYHGGGQRKQIIGHAK
jgi:hypothetical protein